MRYRSILATVSRCFGLLLVTLALGSPRAAADRPNILWITAEDMSPTLGCYDDEYADTPNIDRLCGQSVKYVNAFATAPVCSPSRSCLITGCYAPSLGTQQMRSAFPLPASMTGFPSELRKAGYFTSNNVKTDYNNGSFERIIAASWDQNSDQGHWRNRKGKQPFFSVFNLMTSHQSRTMVWPRQQFVEQIQSQLSGAEVHDPAKALLPPYYPDTPVVRRTVARFYDCVTVMDKQVGEILKQLEADGLAEDTIVFFYSDHGSGMPRHKRALLDSGLHVPLLIRFPKKYQHLAPAPAGETTDHLVNFVDFGPTVLSLSNQPIPAEMQGEAFLGEQAKPPRQFIFCHRDRIDEVMDCARAVRDRRYLYVRNYMPHLGHNQRSAWPEQGMIRDEFYQLVGQPNLSAAIHQFVAPNRPVEELYDCQNDPNNLVNLVGDPRQQARLDQFRRTLQTHLHESRDLGFIPEIDAWRLFQNSTPWETVRAKSKNGRRIDLTGLMEAANQVGIADQGQLVENLQSRLAGVRYWGAVGLAGIDRMEETSLSALRVALKDSSYAVRIQAADSLIRHGESVHALPALLDALQQDDLTTVLYAARTIQLTGISNAQTKQAMSRAKQRALALRPADTPATVVTSGEQDLAMFIGFATDSFLKEPAAGEWVQLFDGKTLNGWKALAEAEVSVNEGEIHILSKGKNLWLLHEKEFADFELTVEVKMPDDAYNSGIGFRCQQAGGRPKGYQCEIERQKTGMIYAIGSGWVWPKGPEETRRFKKMAGSSFDNEKWNQLRVLCQGKRIQIWVNGTKTADVQDDRFSKGRVALQHHGKGAVHRFRKIRIRPID